MTREISKIDQHVGRRIKQRRMAMGMTQTELANAVGVSFQQVQKYETGFNRVSASRLFEIAEHLQVNLSFFWAGLKSDYALKDDADPLVASDASEAAMLSAYRECPEGARASLVEIAQAAGREA